MHNTYLNVGNNTPEVKKQVGINLVQQNKNLLWRLLNLTADWLKLLRIMGFIIMFIKNLKDKSGKDDISVKSMHLLKDAECKIVNKNGTKVVIW